MRVLLLIGLLVASASAQYTTLQCDGRQVIVHLFEWKWTDIADECERFLGPMGFCAVQVSPPNEHAVITTGGNNYPWWERYQPVSYNLVSRSGDRAQFIDMVDRCRAVGVRILVDAVINHMVGVGTSPPGSGGSDFSANDRNNLNFPAVPYSSSANDFTPRSMCPSSSGDVDNYNDPNNIRNCYLVSLTDLYQGNVDVRNKIAAYFNDLLDIGVMGFRVDASKHMWPGDLLAIQEMTNNLNTAAGYPANTRPFFAHEVIDHGGEAISVDEYFDNGRVTEFRYCNTINTGVHDVSQIGALYRPSWNMADYDHAFVFVDNHDNQRTDSSILTYKDGTPYSNAVVYTLAQDYGVTRIMSSYDFTDSDQGPPSNGPNTNDVTINADGSCGGGWVCEHRWSSISKMVQFRNAVNDGTYKDNWFQQGNTVAFSRGNKGFFAMNTDGNYSGTLQTGLPAGSYCDLITDCAKTITVNADGTANIVIDKVGDPFVAICVGCSAVKV